MIYMHLKKTNSRTSQHESPHTSLPLGKVAVQVGCAGWLRRLAAQVDVGVQKRLVKKLCFRSLHSFASSGCRGSVWHNNSDHHSFKGNLLHLQRRNDLCGWNRYECGGLSVL